MFGNTTSPVLRKCITILCVTALLIMQIPANVFAVGGKMTDTTYLDRVETLEKLGILLSEDDMQYSEENVTREKFALFVGAFYGVPRTGSAAYAASAQTFTDVSPADPNFNAIETAVRMGAMDGYTDKKFRPLENITAGEAIRAAVVLLGYDEIVSYRGGTDSDYIVQAQRLGLLNGIKKDADAAITKGEIVELLFAALDTKMLLLKGAGSSKKYETDKNKTLLTETLGFYKIEGIVQATEITSVGSAEACGKGFITVNGYNIRVSEDMGKYLGMYVYAYCSGDKYMSELSLIHIITSQKKNISVTVDADDIISFENKVLSYWENGIIQKVSLPLDANVILNGKNNPIYSDRDFLVEEGNITLLDANADGTYETVFIKSYMDVWVGQVFFEKGNVYVIDKNDTSKKYSLDNKDLNRKVVYKTITSLTTYDSVKSDSIISIAADKMDLRTKTISDSAEYIEVLISDQQVSGTVSLINMDENKITIGDAVYTAGYDFDPSACEITPGSAAKFYLNFFNQITAAEKVNKQAYGILYNARTKGQLSDSVQMRIFTLDNMFKVFDCTDRLHIDGRLYNDSNSILDALRASSIRFFADSGMSSDGAGDLFQLIRYTMDTAGVITEIDTVEPNSDDPEIEKNHLKYSNFIPSGTRYFNKSYATTIDGGYVYDSNLRLFRIPSDLKNEAGFSVKTTLADALAYELIDSPVYGFDMNEYKYIPLMIVQREAAAEKVAQKEENRMIVFEGVSTVMDDEGGFGKAINGTSVKTGGKLQAILKEDKVLEDSGAVPGDIIRWVVDDYGRVITIEVTMKNDGANSTMPPFGGPRMGFYTDFRITCGMVENMNSKYILFKYGSMYECSLRNPSAKVLVYDSKTKTTTQGGYDSIKTIAAFGDEASLVFTLQLYTALQTIVVFK